MCACEPSFVCSKCRDTPRDDRYEENEREPLPDDLVPFDLEREPRA